MFNKPLVAAVHGDLLGMGVTILPLFDVVIAQDTTTFLTPYAVFGYLPEAMKLFSSAKNLKPKAVNFCSILIWMFFQLKTSISFQITDMLFLSRKVSASTALDYGIVSEVTSSEKLQERADIVTKKLATLSQQVSLLTHTYKSFLILPTSYNIQSPPIVIVNRHASCPVGRSSVEQFTDFRRFVIVQIKLALVGHRTGAAVKDETVIGTGVSTEIVRFAAVQGCKSGKK